MNKTLLEQAAPSRYLAFLVVTLFISQLSAQPESWYVSRIAQTLSGQTEFPVDNGRVDIVTDEYAIEVERASNWKHSIGQSLWYGMQTNRKPGIVLIMTTIEDRKHGIRLQSALDYAGIGDKVKVWLYPEDFNTTFEKVQDAFTTERQSDPKVTGYWLTISSNVRHNSTCSWYANSNGRYCQAGEGRACGKCGG